MSESDVKKLVDKLQDLVTLEFSDGPVVLNEDRTYTLASARLKRQEAIAILARGKMNSCMIEFEDGFRAIVSRNALRRAAREGK